MRTCSSLSIYLSIYKPFSLTFLGDATEHSERLVSVHLDGVSFLVVVAWAGDGPIVRDPFFEVDAVVGASGSPKSELISSVVAILWFFEITWQFVLARLGELVKIF